MTPKTRHPPVPVSVVIITLNCAANLRECLRRLSRLSYPKNLIEILVIDGGSKDDTENVAREFGAQFHSLPDYREKSEARRGIGLSLAKNEYVLSLDSDNFIPPGQPDWLEQMLAPLQDDPALIGSQTLHWTFEPQSPLLTKYLALMGGGDPVAIALGKQDKVPMDQDKWTLLGRPEDKGDYVVVQFEPKVWKVPTIGCNPFLGRKSLLLLAQSDPEHFLHTDVLVDLIHKGHNRMAFCKKASIIHESKQGLGDFLSRRFRYAMTYRPEGQNRRYYILTWQGYPNLAWYILTSLTFVLPTVRSLRGYWKVREKAWFLNPLLSFLFVFLYIPLAYRTFSPYLVDLIRGPRVAESKPAA